MAFIYQIRRIDTGQCYVGHTTKRIEIRWAAHLTLLEVGKHHSRYLQNAWNKHGVQNFVFEIIEECPDESKLFREQFYIDALDSCFNAARVAGSRLGVLYTEEQKIRLSALRMGHSTTEEAKLKIGAAHKGKQWKLGYKLTDEQRERCSEAQKGIPRPYMAEISILGRAASPANKPGWIPWHRIGAVDSPETIERRVKAVAETKARRKAEGRDYSLSLEHKAALSVASAARKGETRSEIARANIKAGHAHTWDDPAKVARMMENRRPFNWYTDGTRSKRVAIDDDPPEGWVEGRTSFKWITDGTTGRQIKENDDIPEGWRLGFGPRKSRKG